MTRTVAAGITTHLATYTHSRCRMLRLDLVDGSQIAITDHDQELSVNLGDGAVTYSPRTGIIASDLALSTGFDADDIEVSGPLMDEATEDWHITKAMVIGGRFDDAEARFFQVNWNSLADGAIKLIRGYVVRADVEGSKFKLTIHSEISKFAQEVGRTITPYCDADFGDTRCGYTPATLAATVTAVADKLQFTVSFTGAYANDYWNRGTVTFLTGDLAGTRPVEILDWTSGGVVTLFTDLAEAPGIGDTLTITQGCGKTRADCLVYDNVINFRGFPDVPGTDQVMRYPNPGG